MKKNIVAILCIVIVAGCSTSKQTTRAAAGGIFEPYGPAWATLWQQRSAEYKALCFQAYNIARLRLDAALANGSVQNPAIVTDIDETILDNSPYTAHQALQGKGYSDSSWVVWTSKVAADTVPGALSFLKYAASRGVQIFYVTNRLPVEQNPTIANLQKWNFPNADEMHLLLKQQTSNKDARRSMVASRHTVLLFMGDNLGDFSGVFDHQSYDKRNALAEDSAMTFGNKFIVLPNPMYGEWLNALLHYDFKQTVPQQNENLRKWLKTY